MSTHSLTNWDDLSAKRQDVLETAESEFGEDTFACGELNDFLAEPTTTDTLNNIWEENGYLRKSSGGSTMLLAIIPDDENKTAFTLSAQEDLAARMVRREGLSLDARAVNWRHREERERFAEEFNAQSTEVELNATWTRNKYWLHDEAREVIRRN